MSSSAISNIEFNQSVEKLKTDGSNWIMFQRRFTIAMNDRELYEHLTGDAVQPSPVDAAKPTDAEKASIKEWKKNENKAMSLLVSRLHDSTFTKYMRKTTVAEIWAGLITEFSMRSMLKRSNMRADFMALSFTPGSNLRNEFSRVTTEYEQLINLGVEVSDEEYRSLIFKFVPIEIANHLSSVSASMKTLRLAQKLTQSPGASETPAVDSELDPTVLMDIALDHWEMLERQKISKLKMKETKRDPGVAAAGIMSSEKPGTKTGGGNRWKGKGRNARTDTKAETRRELECWNCGGKGHRTDKCPSLKQDKRESSSNSRFNHSKSFKEKEKEKSTSTSSPSAAANLANLDDVAGAWSAYPFDLEDVTGAWSSYPFSLDDDALDLSSAFLQMDLSPHTLTDHPLPDGLFDPEHYAFPLPEEDNLQYINDYYNPELGRLSVHQPEPEVQDVEPFPRPYPGLRLVSDNGADFPTPIPQISNLPTHDWDIETDTTGEPPALEGEESDHGIAVIMAGSCKGESFGNLPKEEDDDNHGSALVAVSGILEGQRCDLYDSGATHHMTPYRDEFTIFHQMPPKRLTAANQGSFTADRYGDVIISVPNGDRISKIHLRNVLYTPAVGFSLISISQIDDAGFSVTFGGQCCTIHNKDGNIVGSIAKSQNLYRIIRQPNIQVGSSNAAEAVDEPTKLSVMELHRRMGHIAPTAAKMLVVNGHVAGVTLIDSLEPLQCEACIKAKSARKAIPKVRQGEQATEFGQEIHSDIWGPTKHLTLGGRKYFISFTDDCCRWTTVFTLATKKSPEVLACFKSFKAWVLTQLKVVIECLRTDRGREYLSGIFEEYLDSKGI